MTALQRKQVEDWFERLVDSRLEDVRLTLERECDDAGVRDEVLRLIGNIASDAADSDVSRAFRREADRLTGTLDWVRPGTRFGHYVIVELVGRGGMGDVYMAEQRHPLKRTVAIKVIKLGFDTPQVIARFDSERQALARMDHPNVARVLDAGVTESGRPYFVMEYVPGLPITRFADENRLTLRERLMLFTQACDAIAHAHTKAILHRDIKASNVLAYMHDGKPTVKVIDFGIAKALTGERLSDLTFNTEQGNVIGTYDSMSPEQAEGSPDIDTRTDVYSLGVLLYEVLSGVKPFDSDTLRSSPDHEIRRIIREMDPPRPSTRLATLGSSGDEVADARQVRLDQLSRQLRGELEWIPLKAMRKDRQRRYASPQQLAEDIHNYLAGRPLLAGPESRAYRARKFLRRHKGGVAASAAMFFLLLGGIIATTWQATRATRAEANTSAALGRAQSAIASMRDVNDFLTYDLLWSVDPGVARGRELTVRDALDKAAATVGTRLKDRPLSEIAVRAALAGAYQRIDRGDLALPQAQAALDIINRTGSHHQPEACEAMNIMGEILKARDQLPAAEQMFRQAWEGRRRAMGEDDPATLYSLLHLARVVREQGKLEEAELLHRDVLARCRRALGPDDWRTCSAINSMGSLLRAQGKLDQAERMFREAIENSRRIQGEDHPETLDYMGNLAGLMRQKGDAAQAEQITRTVLAHRRRIEGDDALATLLSMNRLARLLIEQGRFADAEKLFREELGRRRRVQGNEHHETLGAAMNLALALNRTGQLDQAEVLLKETLDVQRRVLGEDHPQTVTSINNLGGLLFDRRKFSEAEPLFRSALQARLRIFGESHPETLSATSNLARTLRELGRLQQAEPLFATLYRHSSTAPLPPRQAALFMAHWGPCLAALGRHADAEAPLHEALRRLRETDQTKGDHMRRVLTALAEVCNHTHRPDEAARWQSELQALQAATQPATTQPASGEREWRHASSRLSARSLVPLIVRSHCGESSTGPKMFPRRSGVN